MTPSEPNLTWKEVVRNALTELGGQGHLSQINAVVRGHPKTRTNPTWKDTIRRVVRQYAIFEAVPPGRSGIYRLVEQPPLEADPENMTGAEAVDHGMLRECSWLWDACMDMKPLLRRQIGLPADFKATHCLISPRLQTALSSAERRACLACAR